MKYRSILIAGLVAGSTGFGAVAQNESGERRPDIADRQYEDDLFDVNDEWVDQEFDPWEDLEYDEWDYGEQQYEEFTERHHYESEYFGWESDDHDDTGWDYDPARSDWDETADWDNQERAPQDYEGYGFYEHVYEWELDKEDTQLFDGWYEEGGIY